MVTDDSTANDAQQDGDSAPDAETSDVFAEIRSQLDGAKDIVATVDETDDIRSTVQRLRRGKADTRDVQDVAIEEKVDAARIEDELEQARDQLVSQEELADALARIEADIDAVQEEMATAAVFDQLTTQIDDLRDQWQQQVTKLKQELVTAEKLEQSLDQLREETAAQSDLASVREELETVRSLAIEEKVDREALEDQIEELRDEMVSSAAIQDVRDELQQVEQNAVAERVDVASLEQRVQTLQDEKASITTLDRRINQVLDGAERNRAELVQRIANLEIADIQGGEDITDRVEEVEETQQRHGEWFNELQSQFDEWLEIAENNDVDREMVEDLEDRITHICETQDRFDSKFKELDSEKADSKTVKSEIESLKTRITELSNATVPKQEVKRLEEKINHLHQQVEQESGSQDAAVSRDEFESLQSDVVELSEILVELYENSQ